MLIKRSWLLIVIALIILIGAGLEICSCNIFKNQTELALSQYPSAFKKNTLIVIGENASATESEAAGAVAEDLEKYKGDIPEIKSDTEITEEDRVDNNLILIGIKDSNAVLVTVLEKNKAEMITDAYPGENKGVIEILSNPWNSERVVLVIAGSDEKGVIAGSEMMEEVQDINKVRAIVEWDGVNGVFPRLIPVDKYIFVEFLQEISGAPVMIDHPVEYHFNSDSGVLEGGNFEINEILTIVTGYSLEIKEPGGGQVNGVIPTYTIPSSLSIPLLWKIAYLDADGTVYLRYENTKVELKSGAECQIKLATEWMGQEATYIAKIKNYGLQDKDKIKLSGTGGY